MVLGYQLFRDRRVLDARPDLVGDEFGEKIVGLLVEQQIAESAQPDAIARLVVERFEQGVALFFRNVDALARVAVIGKGGVGDFTYSRMVSARARRWPISSSLIGV